MFVKSDSSNGASRALSLVGLIVFGEPLASTLLIPFVYFMVRDFTSEQGLIGFRVGLITSSFYLCQMVTTPLWGMFSDRYGRRKTFVIGLLGGAMSLLCFGMSRSLLWAVLSRSICGLLNGNIGVARTTIGEIAAKYQIAQSKAFSVLGLAGAFGYIAGPLIGGLLSKPAEIFGLYGPYNMFVEYPYLLPCLVGASFNLATLVAVLFGLEETNASNKVDMGHPRITLTTEEQPLLPQRILTEAELKMQPQPSWKLPKEVVILLIATSFICLHTISFEEVYALFAASSLEDGTGLDFSSKDIAISLSVLGPIVFVAQMFAYPWLNARIDTIKLWKLSAVSFAVDYPLVSLLPLITNGPLRWAALIITLCVRVATHVIGWTSLNIITNHVVEPGHRGFVTGIVQASASLSRGLGPALGGTLWSWSLNNGFRPPFDFHIFFLAISFVATLQGAVGCWIPRKAGSLN